MVAEKINQYSAFKPDFGAQLSNHLPMTLFALNQLDADETHIKTYLVQYLPRLERVVPAKGMVNIDNWQDFLGFDERYQDYKAYFISLFEQNEIETVLAEYLPFFLNSPAAKAYHCMLRTAYGLLSNNKLEIASGLAYWAISYKPLFENVPLVYAQNSALFDIEIFNQIHRWRQSHKLPKIIAQNIHSRYKKIAALKEVEHDLSVASPPSSLTLKAVARQCLTLYLSTDDFTMLHGMTATHALRVLLPFVKETAHKKILYCHWQSIIIGFLSIGAPKVRALKDLDLRETLSIEDIKKNLAGNLDDHDIKITFTAIEEAAFYEDERFLLAAKL